MCVGSAVVFFISNEMRFSHSIARLFFTCYNRPQTFIPEPSYKSNDTHNQSEKNKTPKTNIFNSNSVRLLLSILLVFIFNSFFFSSFLSIQWFHISDIYIWIANYKVYLCSFRRITKYH